MTQNRISLGFLCQRIFFFFLFFHFSGGGSSSDKYQYGVAYYDCYLNYSDFAICQFVLYCLYCELFCNPCFLLHATHHITTITTITITIMSVTRYHTCFSSNSLRQKELFFLFHKKRGKIKFFTSLFLGQFFGITDRLDFLISSAGSKQTKEPLNPAYT